MIRSSKHILKYQTKHKTNWLDKLFDIYQADVQLKIEGLYLDEIPLMRFMSSKKVPTHHISGGVWKCVSYKQASEIIRGVQAVERKKHTELPIPILKNVTVPFDQQLHDIKITSGEFDGFVRVFLPFTDVNNRRITICLPYREHKHSLKYKKGWIKKNTVNISKKNGNYYLTFFYYREEKAKRKTGKSVGFDSGYRHFLVDDKGNFYGDKLNSVYEKLAKQKRGSKNYKQTLIERDKLINETINTIPLKDVKQFIVEDLKNVKRNSKFSKKLNNRLQYWSYSKGLSRLERVCEENGIQFTKVPPAYTSQRCPCCGTIDKDNRKGEEFLCIGCGYSEQADVVGAKNIRERGVYNPSTKKTEFIQKR